MRVSSGTVDTRSCFCRIATHETGEEKSNERWQKGRTGENLPLLIEEQDAGTTLKKSVGGRETCETASDDDDLSHYRDVAAEVEMVVSGISEVKVWDEREDELL